MARRIISKRGRPAPAPTPELEPGWPFPTGAGPRIIINPDGTWTYPGRQGPGWPVQSQTDEEEDDPQATLELDPDIDYGDWVIQKRADNPDPSMIE
jgi:hypothetical protein